MSKSKSDKLKAARPGQAPATLPRPTRRSLANEQNHTHSPQNQQPKAGTSSSRRRSLTAAATSAATPKPAATSQSNGRSVASAATIEDAVFIEGDFTLVSSDNVLFKARSIDLRSWSNVFNEAGDVVASSDYETAAVLRRFLEIIKEGQYNVDEIQDVPNLIKFLTKYECELAMKIVYSSLQSSTTCQFEIFKLGCDLDDPEIAACAFGDSYSSSQYDDVSIVSSAIAASYEEYLSIPPEYAWALWKAKNGYMTNARRNFTAGLEEAKEKTSKSKSVAKDGAKKTSDA